MLINFVHKTVGNEVAYLSVINEYGGEELLVFAAHVVLGYAGKRVARTLEEYAGEFKFLFVCQKLDEVVGGTVINDGLVNNVAFRVFGIDRNGFRNCGGGFCGCRFFCGDCVSGSFFCRLFRFFLYCSAG